MPETETPRVIDVLADLLMGAAYADQHFDGREEAAVRRKLAEWLEVDELPSELEERLATFDPGAFDLEATAALLEVKNHSQARRVLELVVAVHEADEELDLEEDEYVNRLAHALHLDEVEYEDLTLEVLGVEELREGLKTLGNPPPVPRQ